MKTLEITNNYTSKQTKSKKKNNRYYSDTKMIEIDIEAINIQNIPIMIK